MLLCCCVVLLFGSCVLCVVVEWLIIRNRERVVLDLLSNFESVRSTIKDDP